jgi:hypothetical protein
LCSVTLPPPLPVFYNKNSDEIPRNREQYKYSTAGMHRISGRRIRAFQYPFRNLAFKGSCRILDTQMTEYPVKFYSQNRSISLFLYSKICFKFNLGKSFTYISSFPKYTIQPMLLLRSGNTIPSLCSA